MMEFEEAVTVPVPIPVFCGPIIRRDMTRPCSVYFDLTILPDNDSDSSILLHSGVLVLVLAFVVVLSLLL